MTAKKLYITALTIFSALFLVLIGTGVIAKNVMYEKMNINNAFVKFFYPLAGEEASSDIAINWEQLYPQIASDSSQMAKENEAISVNLNSINSGIVGKYLGVVDKIKNLSEWYTRKTLPFRNEMINIVSRLEHILGCETDGIGTYSNVIYMDNGYLVSMTPKIQKSDIEEMADSVSEFRDFLEGEGIDFLFVTEGSKICPSDRQTDSPDFSNENIDELLDELSKRDIAFMDMRKELTDSDINWYDMYYRTDFHWKTEAGLWAAGRLAGRLNSDYGFEFDMERFNPDEYEMTTKDNYFLGGEGRKVSVANAEPEAYTRIIPRFDTDYEVSIPSTGYEARGTYDEVLFDERLYESIEKYSDNDFVEKPDAYTCSRIRNNPLTVIKNKAPHPNEGRKIMMIEDSFSWYLTSFIANGVDETDILCAGFPGSERAYVLETKPDMVIMNISTRNISEIDWESKTSPFDLR